MDSLLYSTISDKLKTLPAYRELFKAIEADDYPLHLLSIRGSLLAFLLEKISKRRGKPLLVVMPTEQEADILADDLRQFELRVITLPWWGTVPYRPAAQNSPIFGRRLKALEDLLSQAADVVCTSVRAFLSPFPPPEYIRAKYLSVRPGQELDPVGLARQLDERGYLRVKRVSMPGEFALRGEVCDVFMPGDEEPTRLVFEWNKVEQIRRFSPFSQSSVADLEELRLRPSREIIWDDEAVAMLRESLASLPELRGRVDEIIDTWIIPQKEGHERYFPLIFEEAASITDYLGDGGIVCIGEYERCLSAWDGLQHEYDTMYRKIRHSEPVAMPRRLLFDFREREAACPALLRFPLLSHGRQPPQTSTEASPKASTETSAEAEEEVVEDGARGRELHFGADGPRSFFGNINFFREEIGNLSKAGYRIFLLVDSELQHQRLEHLLKDSPVDVLTGSISAGFSIPELSLMLIHENEVFGRKRRIPQSVKRVQSEAIESFVDLDENDYVVHVNHGIGRFIDIQRIHAGENERDYIKIEYADEEFIFVPIEQVNLIQRYIGSQGSAPRLDKIGGKSWGKRKTRVSGHVEELASHLIDLYSKRQKVSGYAFPPDSEWQIEFEAAFPFEETEDQIRCIDDVKADMEKPMPMDRLVCGDVGYGKTEIAMRAAFKALSAGKQVALLAPTTILAEQHYETIADRTSTFPISIRMMSRLVPPAEQKKTLAGLAAGEIDLVVGTHRIIQKDVVFKNLGLLVIDEEQRFGVKDKEHLKALKASIDCLTLSATPIPRTLHMSLLKIRDMSLLKTPPYNRRPIETHVEPFNEELAVAAIRREVARGGQTFYLHNRIETLEYTQLLISRLIPEILVEKAHGQMAPHDLEDIMHRFINGAFQVLVTTTIIENGIDIPNVNTIIIDRADMYGISQLYQLRGRVGRSGRLAYAYLFYPERQSLSELAMKRLQIISDNTDLGSGFKIAMKDLEVRGAGNLLGREQSGDIYSIGFDLYLKLLDQAIRRLSENAEPLPEEIYLEMEYTGFIPDSYIPDTMEKMDVYKRIAAVNTQDALDSVHAEITDRFGPLPDELASLLSLAEIRVLCRQLGIARISERRGLAQVHFARVAHLNIDRIMELIRTSGGAVKPDPRHPHVLLVDTSMIGLKEKSEYLRDRLSSIVG